MALQKQLVSVPFNKGVDTKSDPKQVIQGKLITLENGIFQSLNRIKKRNGYKALSQLIEGDDSISSGSGLANFKNEILLLTGTEAYSFSDSTTKWVDKQTVTNLQIATDSIVRNTYEQTTPDVAIHSSGLEIITYEDSRGGSRYTIIDSVTNDTVVSDILISATAIKPKAFSLGNFLVILYVETATFNLRMLSIPVVSPSTPIGTRDIAVGISNSHPNYDGALYGTSLYVAYNTAAGINTIFINKFLSPTFPNTQSGESASSCIAIATDSTLAQIWVAYHNGTQVKYFILDSMLNLIVILAPTVISANSNTINNIALIANDGSGDVYYTQNAALPSNNFILEAALTNTGVVTGNQVFVRSVGIAGKPFTYNGITYIITAFDTTLQPTYFILRTSDAAVVGKFAPDNGGGLLKRNIVPESCPMSLGIYLVAYLQKDLLTTISGAVYTQTGVNVLTIDFVDAAFDKIELGANLHLTGGLLTMYDGISIVEHGFNVFPENVTVVPPSGMAIGGIGAGTRQYSVVYSWMDAQGQTHYSAPSIPVTEVLTASGSPFTFTAVFAEGDTTLTVSTTTDLFVGQVITDNTTAGNLTANTFITKISGSVITINQPAAGNSATTPGDTLQTVDLNSTVLSIPTLRLTQKKAPVRGPVTIQVYRTEDSQTIFYLVSSITMPLLNDTTVDSVSFFDTSSDNAIVGNPILYTTGGVVENVAAPACSYVTTYKDRIILLPEENPNQWWYSKQNIPGAPVEFSDSFVNNVDQFGGKLVAAARMDSELILLKETFLYYVTGTGPDSTGAQNDFSDPIGIACDGGCIDKNSVILTPAGLMYKSQKGIYLLGRNLTVQYIGADVEAFNSSRVLSANLLEDVQQVRFCLDSGVCLVYDYYVQQWSVFTNHVTVDAINFQGEFTYLRSNGKVLKETPGQFTDDGEFIKLKAVTSWLSFTGLQGFQRVYKLLLLGEYFNPHNVSISAAYDFNPFATQQNVVPAGTLLATGNWGSDPTWGSSSPWGGPNNTYQFRVNLTRQKCEAIQFTIEDQQLGSSFGENLAISAFGFEVGTKGGLNRLIAAGGNTQIP